MRWLRRGEPLLVAALGALQSLAFFVTAAWALPLVAQALLVWRLNAAGGARRAFLLGWCFGIGWLLAGVWWLFISMHRYGGLPAPLAAAAVFALCGALSLYLALACAVYSRWRRGAAAPDAVLFAALWFLAEWCRAWIFTGFPWVASGYAQVDAPLAWLAPFVGVFGVGLAGAALAAWVAGLWARPGSRAAAGSLAAVALFMAPGLWPAADFTEPGATLSVRLLQTNVAQDEKFAADRLPQTLAWVAAGLKASTSDLVVIPETAVPLLPDQLKEVAPGYWEALEARFAGTAQSALVGVPLGDFDRGYTNSVVGLGPGAPYRYDKFHLVPFGEFIPTGFRWFTDMMQIPLGDFSRGLRVPPSFVVKGERVAPNICYEDLFGEELAARFADPATAPTLMANVSNIGWFGDTIAIDQHLHSSRFRTLEFQRPMIRSTNTGATAVIDHRGVVTARLPPFTHGVLEAPVQGRRGMTPYARWAAWGGLWPMWALALTVVAVLRWTRGSRG